MSGIQPRDLRGMGQPGPYQRGQGHPGGTTSSNPTYGPISGNPYGGAYAYSPPPYLSQKTVLSSADFCQRYGYPPYIGGNSFYRPGYPVYNGVTPLSTTSNHYIATYGSDAHFRPTPTYARSHQNLHHKLSSDWEAATASGMNKEKKASNIITLASQPASHARDSFDSTVEWSDLEKDIKLKKSRAVAHEGNPIKEQASKPCYPLCELEASLQECSKGKKNEKHDELTGTHSPLSSNSSTETLSLTPGSTPPTPSTTKVTGAFNNPATSTNRSKLNIRLKDEPRTKPTTQSASERLLADLRARTAEKIAHIKEPADKIAYIRERNAPFCKSVATATAAAPANYIKPGGLFDNDSYEELPVAEFPKPKAAFVATPKIHRQHSVTAAPAMSTKTKGLFDDDSYYELPVAAFRRQHSVAGAVQENHKFKDASKAQFLVMKEVLLKNMADLEKVYVEADFQRQKKIREAMMALLESPFA